MSRIKHDRFAKAYTVQFAPATSRRKACASPSKAMARCFKDVERVVNVQATNSDSADEHESCDRVGNDVYDHCVQRSNASEEPNDPDGFSIDDTLFYPELHRRWNLLKAGTSFGAKHNEAIMGVAGNMFICKGQVIAAEDEALKSPTVATMGTVRDLPRRIFDRPEITRDELIDLITPIRSAVVKPLIEVKNHVSVDCPTARTDEIGGLDYESYVKLSAPKLCGDGSDVSVILSDLFIYISDKTKLAYWSDFFKRAFEDHPDEFASRIEIEATSETWVHFIEFYEHDKLPHFHNETIALKRQSLMQSDMKRTKEAANSSELLWPIHEGAIPPATHPILKPERSDLPKAGDNADDLVDYAYVWDSCSDVPSRACGKCADVPGSDAITTAALIELYIFAARYLLPFLRRAIIEKLHDHFESFSHLVFSASELLLITANLTPQTPLYRLAVTLHAKRWRMSNDGCEDDELGKRIEIPFWTAVCRQQRPLTEHNERHLRAELECFGSDMYNTIFGGLDDMILTADENYRTMEVTRLMVVANELAPYGRRMLGWIPKQASVLRLPVLRTFEE